MLWLLEIVEAVCRERIRVLKDIERGRDSGGVIQRTSDRTCPFDGLTDDPKASLRVQETIRRLVRGDLSHIVPGHEPGIYVGGNTHAVISDGSPTTLETEGVAAESPTDSGSFDK